MKLYNNQTSEDVKWKNMFRGNKAKNNVNKQTAC